MFHIIIPARFGSVRLPGKALLPIEGKPLLGWVWERASSVGAISVIVATDDKRIRDVMTELGADVEMTSPDHVSGTDRVAEVIKNRALPDNEMVVNLQGDEPMMPISHIQLVAEILRDVTEADMSTLMEPLAFDESLEPSVVKVVVSETGRALYFSRSRIPANRDGANETPLYRHLGLYAYRVKFLKRFVSWPISPLEQSESLEQLRALSHDAHIQMGRVAQSDSIGVDTEEDLVMVRRLMAANS